MMGNGESGATYGEGTYGEGTYGHFRPQSGAAQTQPVQVEPGATKTAEHRHMDLLEHSTQLGRLVRFDWSRPFGAFGALSLSEVPSGALASGNSMTSTGVIIFGVFRIILLICAVAIRKERVVSARDVKADFDRRLSFFDHDEVLGDMRRRYQDAEREETARLRSGSESCGDSACEGRKLLPVHECPVRERVPVQENEQRVAEEVGVRPVVEPPVNGAF